GPRRSRSPSACGPHGAPTGGSADSARSTSTSRALTIPAMGLLGRIVINAIAIAVAAYVISGISYGHAVYGYGEADKWISLGLTALVLGIVNSFVRPIISMIAVPLPCHALGL